MAFWSHSHISWARFSQPYCSSSSVKMYSINTNFNSITHQTYPILFPIDDEPPPEPAPPEIPPRAQSLLATIAKKLSSHTLSHSLKAQEAVDVKHEEFIPQNQQGKCKYWIHSTKLAIHTMQISTASKSINSMCGYSRLDRRSMCSVVCGRASQLLPANRCTELDLLTFTFVVSGNMGITRWATFLRACAWAESMDSINLCRLNVIHVLKQIGWQMECSSEICDYGLSAQNNTAKSSFLSSPVLHVDLVVHHRTNWPGLMYASRPIYYITPTDKSGEQISSACFFHVRCYLGRVCVCRM